MITADIIKTCHFPFCSRGHGTGMFFSMYRCTEYPRLKVMDRSDKKLRETKRIYIVDGVHREDLVAAIAALNLPPELDLAERGLLATVPDDWADPPGGKWGDLYSELYMLVEKGLGELGNRKYRKTEEGKKI